MLNYKEELEKAMLLLAEKEDTFFLGQSLEYGGIAMAQTFQKISSHKKLEMPVAENLQMGISTGLALEGFVPITVFPRWNFLLVASDQLVNHLDKIILMNLVVIISNFPTLNFSNESKSLYSSGKDPNCLDT